MLPLYSPYLSVKPFPQPEVTTTNKNELAPPQESSTPKFLSIQEAELRGFQIIRKGDPKEGTIFIYGQTHFHPSIEENEPAIQSQQAILDELMTLKVKDVFEEGLWCDSNKVSTHEELGESMTLEVKDVFEEGLWCDSNKVSTHEENAASVSYVCRNFRFNGEKEIQRRNDVKRLFKDYVKGMPLTEEMGIHFLRSASSVYVALYDDVILHATTTRLENHAASKVIDTVPTTHERGGGVLKMLAAGYEKTAMSHVIAFLNIKKANYVQLALTFGANHPPENLAKYLDDQNCFPQVFYKNLG